MEITYPTKEADIALLIDGCPVKYRIPPVTAKHPECFRQITSNPDLRVAQGREIVAYAHGALVYMRNEWGNQDLLRFPTKNSLRFPKVLTIIPITNGKRFGDLEGGMLVDSDLIGEGVEKKTEVPYDLSGWTVKTGRILENDSRLFIPYDSWYCDQWDSRNGAVIALTDGDEEAELLMRTTRNSRRNNRLLWKLDPRRITSPKKRVPVLVGFPGGLALDCDDDGTGDGCAARVLK